MRILITGANGFIGGFLVQEALNRGYEIWAGVRGSSNCSNLQDPRIRFMYLDYQDLNNLTQQLAAHVQTYGSWDYVIHNAGVTKTLDKAYFYQVNALYTHNLIEALHGANCSPQKFILMSSLSAFGKGDEKLFTPISLNDTPQPDTAYGKSKLAAELFLMQQTYFPYVILRPTGVYGPGDKDYFVALKSIKYGLNFSAGMVHQRLTFIYVKDLVSVTFLALENQEVRNQSYFVSDGTVYTDNEFARLAKQALNKRWVINIRIPLRMAWAACYMSEWFSWLASKSTVLNSDKYLIIKQRNWICDVTPLQKDLGFTPQYTLADGLKDAVDWYRSSGWL
jgi:nucleoside-diphosphate-sugar epimerase